MVLIYLGGAAGVLAFLLAFCLARSLRRVALLLVLGLCLLGLWLAVVYVASPSSERPTGCSDCGIHFGRWIDATAIFVAVIANGLAWIIGVLAGSTIRALTKRTARAS